MDSIRKQLDDDGNINELCSNNAAARAGDSTPDSLESCQAGVGFITHRGKSKQSHRVVADKFSTQLCSLSKNDNNNDGISSSCDGGSSRNSDDTAMVRSSLDLVETSTLHEKQNKRMLREINSWEILNSSSKQ